MPLNFNQQRLTFEHLFRTWSSSNLDKYAIQYDEYCLDFKSHVIQTHYGDDHDSFKLTLSGADDCFKASVVCLAHEVYNNDAEFCNWSENAFYAESQIKNSADESVIKAKNKLVELQTQKNKELNEIQKELKEIGQALNIEYKYSSFNALSKSQDAHTIFLQNLALIEDNNKLYRVIVDAARKKSLEYNESAVRAIILALSMQYVHSQDSSILQEASDAYNQYLNPEEEKNTVLIAKRFQLPELGSVYPHLEPAIEFPHLNKQDHYTLYYHGDTLFDTNRVTIKADNVSNLKNKVTRLFINHEKSKTEHSVWLTILRFLKDFVVGIYNKIVNILKTADSSKNPLLKHSDLAENVNNIVNGDAVTKKAQLIHQFNSRPSPLVHVIYDESLSNEDKEDLLTKLATAKPYRFDYQKQEPGNNLEITSDSLKSGSNFAPSGTPLLHTVKRGTSNMVKILLENKANIEAKGTYIGIPEIHYDNVTALHIAVAKSDIEKVKLLLKHGANVNAINKFGQTPLFAVSNVEIFNLLLAKGADINHQSGNGQTPLHFAALHDKKDIVDELIKQSNLQVDLADKLGNTALHVAAATSFKMDDKRTQHFFVFSPEDAKEKKDINLQIMSALIKKGANVNKANHRGYVPLHMAVLDPVGTIGYDAVSQSKLSHVDRLDYEHGLNQVKLLCENGADVNKVSNKLVEIDRFYCSESEIHPAPLTTPLLALYSHTSSFKEEKINKKLTDYRLEIAKYLISKGADPKLHYQQSASIFGIKQQEGYTLLHQCARSADAEAFSYFVSKGLDPNYQASPKHDTPLHVFMSENSPHYSWEKSMVDKTKTFFNSDIDMTKTKLISIEINYNTLPTPSYFGYRLTSSLVELIFKGDNEITRKAQQMGLSANQENQDEVLTKVYKAILDEKYKGQHHSIHVEIPVNALQNTYRSTYGATYEAAKLYQKYATEHETKQTLAVGT